MADETTSKPKAEAKVEETPAPVVADIPRIGEQVVTPPSEVARIRHDRTVTAGNWLVHDDKTYQPGEAVYFTDAELSSSYVSDLASKGIIK